MDLEHGEIRMQNTTTLQAMVLVVKSTQINKSFLFRVKDWYWLNSEEEKSQQCRAALELRQGNAHTACCHLVELVKFQCAC